jgi:hypothetical protein
MRGGFRIRKKYLKQAGWQVVGDSKAGEEGDEITIKASTRTRAFRRAERELLARQES